MKYFKPIVIAALIISLVIIFNLSSKITNLENSIHSINSNQMQLMSRLNDQTYNVERVLNEFKNEQSWISSVTMKIDTEKKDKVDLGFEWQVKELLSNSEVMFHYKFNGDEDYTSLAASEVGNGVFEVSIPIEMEFAPKWDVMISRATNSRDGYDEQLIEEQYMNTNNQKEISYYVTVLNGELLKSSSMHTDYLGYLGTEYYGYLNTHVDIFEHGYYVALMSPPSYSYNGVYVEEASLLKYQNGRFIEEEQLVRSNYVPERNEDFEEIPMDFHKEKTDEKFDYSKLVLKVVYSDGKTFEREIVSE